MFLSFEKTDEERKKFFKFIALNLGLEMVFTANRILSESSFPKHPRSYEQPFFLNGFGSATLCENEP